jgi:copper transport protein
VLLRPSWGRGTPPPRLDIGVAAVLTFALVLGTAATGHPVAGPWPVLATGIAMAHVAAMAVWIGGLAGLVVGLVRAATPADEVAAGLTRFSSLAFGSVVVLVVSGILQAVREVTTPTALVTTTYGWLLVAKVSVVLLALAAAGISRVWVQQRLGVHRARPRKRSLTAHAFAASEAEETAAATRRHAQSESATEHLPSLRRSLLVELLLAVVVLAVTSVLVATPPARSAVSEPVDVTLPLQGSAGEQGSVQISVDPARPGPNILHVYLFDDAGTLTQPAGIEVALTEPAQELGPIDVDLVPAGPGHYSGDGMTIPTAGTWTLTVTVRLDEFTATSARTTFPVR